MFRSETEFVAWLQAQTPRRVRGLTLGIGDDAAVARLTPGRDLILKSDLSIEDVHFSLRLHPARSVGFRALARPLSDVAAMGGTARFALVSIALSKRVGRRWIEEFYDGLSGLARRHRLALVGGDTARAVGRVFIDVALVGDAPRGMAVARSSARPGDAIFVSGRLGMSALGLRLLRQGSRARRGRGSKAGSHGTVADQAIRAHLYPEPRCELGRFLAARGLASAMIDLSDGLSTDLGHLCAASRVGARVWADLISKLELEPSKDPTSLRTASPEALELAVHGGEDYELLFTVPLEKARRLPSSFRGLPLRRIGEIRRSKQVLLIHSDGSQSILRPSGYDHFRED